MLMDSDGTGYSVTSTDESDATSQYGDDHTIGTGNSYIENPLQGVEDLQEATDGDGNDGGFAETQEWFFGTSDPDGDGTQEETLLGHETDLPDAEPTTDDSGDSDSSDDSDDSGGSGPVTVDLSGLQGLGGSTGGSGGPSPVLLVGAAAVVVGAAVYVGGR